MHFRRSVAACLALTATAIATTGCHRKSKDAATPVQKSMARASKVEKPAPPLGPPMDSAGVMAENIFRRTASTGMVAVVVRGDEVWMSGYGRVAPGSNVTPQPDSLFRLCSISKILATDLLSKLIAAKRVSFDDPLQKFAPAGVTVPTMTVRGPAARPLNLGDLATHTGGLPREIAYPPQGAAHFTFPDFPYRWQWLPQFRLRTSPGDAAHYSNISFDLLADAITSASGESYLKFFQEQTATPLGLTDTTLSPNQAQCARLMGGAREPSECTDTQAAAGSGGMYSTAHDMVKVLRYFLNLPGVPVHANGIATGMYLDPTKLHSVQGLGHAGVPDGIGLGWIEINKENGPARIVEKTGGGAGFQTYIALNPARHAGVFFARTQARGNGGANMFREANDMLLAMVGLPPVPVDRDDPERERTAEDLEEAASTRVASRGAARHGVRATVPARSARSRTRAVVRARAAAAQTKATPTRAKTASARTKATQARAKRAVVAPIRRRRR
ncbi:D-alanyl-D-alanine-carboxypeptidase/endopeptidase AmpH [Terriglobus roseus]|uniref:D-alanyl-D-alanine-carboxypeptidase / D-alanyl-D-alanine-endopeptidase n=1 Tax=Terriglobus roseus TaxID=392734 RepID=A0A1H4KCD0_9BACT|nr:D-alanyl-D-alanine-carboxypeptidase/endopeptidase AmpH [Terriglobus roseus]SEB56141.1 D-alanyl-D-alanine-carboxypeptidase / D-alanyl-D-alanine-endopeptidase [Terriglobus roseus]